MMALRRALLLLALAACTRGEAKHGTPPVADEGHSATPDPPGPRNCGQASGWSALTPTAANIPAVSEMMTNEIAE